MLGVIVNSLTVILGTLIGLVFKKAIPQRLGEIIVTGIALCVLYIGISGSLECGNTLVMIIAMIIGALLGECIDLDRRIHQLGSWLERRFSKGEENLSLGSAFVNSTLLFCVGAMAVNGAFAAGLGDNSILFSKAALDGVTAVIYASTMGIGVALSSIALFLYQGALMLVGVFLGGTLDPIVIQEMSAVGSLMIVGLALNMLGITKIKVMNFLPAMFMPIVLIPIFNLF